jgi:hypothetical protein
VPLEDWRDRNSVHIFESNVHSCRYLIVPNLNQKFGNILSFKLGCSSAPHWMTQQPKKMDCRSKPSKGSTCSGVVS